MWVVMAGLDYLEKFDDEGYAVWTRDKSRAWVFPTKDEAIEASSGCGGYAKFVRR